MCALVFQFATDYQNASHVVLYKRGVARPEFLSHAHKYIWQTNSKFKKKSPFYTYGVHIKFTLCQACHYEVIVQTRDNLSHPRMTSLKKLEKLNLSSILALSPPSYTYNRDSSSIILLWLCHRHPTPVVLARWSSWRVESDSSKVKR